MINIIGKPTALKQVNLSLVRKAIREKGSATRAEIVQSTQISITTVRTLLTEMLENGEIFDAGLDESVGGRKAVRYALNKDHFFGVALCMDEIRIRYALVNICGEICKSGSFAVEKDIFESICNFLDHTTADVTIRSIGIGVPGIVRGMSYQRKNAKGELESRPIGELLKQRYDVPVLLENDLNAITLGFGRRYLQEFPDESCKDVHMAYINFNRDCISAGFLSEGHVLRGWNNFSGELGLFPVDGFKTLDALLASPLEDGQYANTVAKLITGICCVLNPQYVAVGGDSFRVESFPLIKKKYSEMLPKEMSAEIILAEGKWDDYFAGMAYLTAEQIFANVFLVKE